MPGHFEAKKHAYRQTQEGIVVSFVIHPDDLDASFAIAPLGTRYMVGFAEIGDDGKPKVSAPMLRTEAERAPEDGNQSAASSGATQKERKAFSDLKPSAQAGIRCGEAKFAEFLASEFGIQFVRSLPLSHEVAGAVRHICKATSRAQFDMNGYPQDAWKQLESQYQSYITTQKYAGLAR